MCQKSRSQLDNKHGAVERLIELLKIALTEKPKRIKTRAPKSAADKKAQEKEKTRRNKKIAVKECDRAMKIVYDSEYSEASVKG